MITIHDVVWATPNKYAVDDNAAFDAVRDYFANYHNIKLLMSPLRNTVVQCDHRVLWIIYTYC